MNPASYKSHTTSRGFTYAYYRSAFSGHDQGSKPTLVLLHGFPATSNCWHHQVAFFEARGYDVIAPDMLGYGGTDKPTDARLYGGNGLARDIVDILDKERVGLEGKRAIAVGHDWGSRVVSRIANLFPDHFIGFAFLALGYLPPAPKTTFEDITKRVEKALGRETFGYQLWLSEEGTAETIKKNFDSFLSLHYTAKPGFKIDYMCPRGAMKEWIESGKVGEIAGYMSEEDVKDTKKALLEGGMEAPLCWYKYSTSGLHMEEDKDIPQSSYTINVPVFYGAAQKDFICVPALYLPTLQEFAKGGLTVKDFEESDHWLPLNGSREDLNRVLLEWIESIVG